MPTPIKELTNPFRLKVAPGATDRTGEERTQAPVMTSTRNKRAIFFPRIFHLLKLSEINETTRTLMSYCRKT